jgi:hypothetical protein
LRVRGRDRPSSGSRGRGRGARADVRRWRWASRGPRMAAAARARAGRREAEEVSPGRDVSREHGLLERLLLVYEEVRRAGARPWGPLREGAALVGDFVEAAMSGRRASGPTTPTWRAWRVACGASPRSQRTCTADTSAATPGRAREPPRQAASNPVVGIR